MSEGGGDAGGFDSPTEAPSQGQGAADCVSGATAGAVGAVNGFFDAGSFAQAGAGNADFVGVGDQGSSEDGVGSGSGKTAERTNAAALGEATDDSVAQALDHGLANSDSADWSESPGPREGGREPSWYTYWKATGKLPPDPRPTKTGLPDWDPDKAYAKNREYLDDLAKGTATHPDLSQKSTMRPFEEWQEEIEKRRERAEKSLDWNRAAVARARSRSPVG